MDGITILDALIIYSLLASPLLSIVLLFFWMSVNVKNTAKVQLLVIVVLFVLGFLGINSSIMVIVEVAAFILLVAWFFAYRGFFSKERLPVTIWVVVLQVIYYVLVIAIVVWTNVGFIFACIISVLSMILLYPWAFGNKKESEGRVFILSIFVVQIMFMVLTITVYLMATVY